MAQQGRSTPESEVAAALQQVSFAMAPVADWWDDYDVLISPVTLKPAWDLGEDAPLRTGMFAAPFSFTGQPALVLPGHWTEDGRPVGVQLVGRRGTDEHLLQLAVALQHDLGWVERRPPDPSGRIVT